MKKIEKLFALSLVCACIGSAAFAGCKTPKSEAYAHPTFFGTQSQATVNDTDVYIVGSKAEKSKNQVAVENKDSVLVDSWVKDVMSLIKDKSKNPNFNPKLPVLRSELAIIIAEGFSLDQKGTKNFKDIPSDYWAKQWIDKTASAGVMIGYPNKTFQPDQPITKAEVFATVAQMIAVPTDRSLTVPDFQGKEIKYIPKWAIAPTKEVVNSQALEQVPNPSKVNDDEYLSKEQVAYLVGWLRSNLNNSSVATDPNASDAIKNYKPTCLDIKLANRISAKHSNIGDRFTAKLVNDVTVGGHTFAAGSKVYGKVVAVKRPGFKNPGYVKVKFLSIKDKETCVDFPKNISNATAEKIKSPNFLARLIGAPLSTAARVVGVAGRTGASGVNVVGNGLEQFGDQLSNGTVELLSLQPVAGVKDYGWSIVTIGKGVYDICKLAVSGVFGVVYEVGDEIVYLILPSKSNESSLNPGEQMRIVF